ncbi:hypothetical protein ATANTOWER_014212 [Ataeniobius toweri]|uniref:Uncharacterized protein n=1 Tax=Ataeniobius toweri TaxID=208326 RepID=A0ABU7CIL6_9TELE|nr:hypothetical protein [Ataeniobius toweri]
MRDPHTGRGGCRLCGWLEEVVPTNHRLTLTSHCCFLTALPEDRPHFQVWMQFPQAPSDLYHCVLPWSAAQSPHLILHF